MESGKPETGKRPKILSPSILVAWLLLALLASAGCSRVPKIIVLKDPLSAAEHVELGVAYERKGELDLAQREYEMALRKDKKLFPARFNLGNVFLAKKEYEKAREEYGRALEIRPGNLEAINNIAWCAIFSGKGIDEALKRMEAAVSGPGGRKPVYLDTLGVLRMRSNLPESAAESFSEGEKLCHEARAGARGGMQGEMTGGRGRQGDCPDEVLRDLEEHRKELPRRFPIPSRQPDLLK